MAKLIQKPVVTCKATLELEENELRALAELSAYGHEVIVNALREHVSRNLVRDHGAGLQAFLRSVRSEGPPIMARLKAARQAFTQE